MTSFSVVCFILSIYAFSNIIFPHYEGWKSILAERNETNLLLSFSLNRIPVFNTKCEVLSDARKIKTNKKEKKARKKLYQNINSCKNSFTCAKTAVFFA